MLLRAIGPCASELTFQHAQLADLIDVELLPSVRFTALTLAANLKTKQTLDATSDAVVVRLDDPGASASVHELDETLVNDRTHQIAIHTIDNIPDEGFSSL